METLIVSQSGVLVVMAAVVAVSLLLQRISFFKRFGPALLCIIVGIILSNLRIVPHWNDA